MLTIIIFVIDILNSNSNYKMKKNASSYVLSRHDTSTLATSAGLLSMYSLSTPPELFDVRCEYEVPRFVDFNNFDDEDYDLTPGSTGIPDSWGLS